MNNKPINDCWNTIGVWGDSSPRCELLEDLIHCHNCDIFRKAGHTLLSRKMEPDYLDEWKNNLSKPRKNTSIVQSSALIFRMGNEWFGLASRFVKEITHCDKHHSLPHRKNHVLRGLVNVRGDLLLNVSLGYLFRISKGDAGNHNKNERYIVINDDKELFAFPVSEVREIIYYQKDHMMPTPSTLKKDTSCYLKGIINHNSHDIGIIDDDILFTALHKNI